MEIRDLEILTQKVDDFSLFLRKQDCGDEIALCDLLYSEDEQCRNAFAAEGMMYLRAALLHLALQAKMIATTITLSLGDEDEINLDI